ncbi:MAG: prepilin-type N-terminal cleavage/methylation domain-containing protein [Candidatus Riflebacteria bacterium]
MKKLLKKGFTLVELSISSFIVALIALILIMVFRSNLNTWQWGQKHMEFNQLVQLVMKQIFTDLKTVNPIVKFDADGNMMFQGEKINDLFPNLVTIYDKDKNPDNGGEEIVFFLTSFNDETRKDRIKYFIEKNKLIREEEDYNGNKKRRVIAEKAKDLFFDDDPGDIRQVHIKVTLIDEKNEQHTENLDFAVRLETDLVCVKVVKNYD